MAVCICVYMCMYTGEFVFFEVFRGAGFCKGNYKDKAFQDRGEKAKLRWQVMPRP